MDRREYKDTFTLKLPKEHKTAFEKDSTTSQLGRFRESSPTTPELFRMQDSVTVDKAESGPCQQEITTEDHSGASGGDSLLKGSEERFSISVKKEESGGKPEIINSSKSMDASKTISRELKYSLIDAASKGDVQPFKEHEELLKRVNLADYDRRTPLHLAAAEGHLEVVRYLIDVLKVDPEFKDRNKKTAYDEAINGKHKDVADFIKSRTGENMRYEIIEAACNGDLDFLKRQRDDGFDMSLADYDQRTPLHLAAAEGHVNVVEFLVKDCKVDVTTQDRWGRTAFDEARRNNKTEIEDLMLKLLRIKNI